MRTVLKHTTQEAGTLSFLRTTALCNVSGQLLGTTFTVESDDPTFLESFQAYFSGLRPLQEKERNNPEIRFRVNLKDSAQASFRVERHTSSGSPAVQYRSLEGHPRPAYGALQMIGEHMLNSARGFFIAHAAVVAARSRGLVLCGPSGIGKTTLTLSLLQEGYLYYSDDYCPFHLANCLVYPFPRSTLIRKTALAPVPPVPDHLSALCGGNVTTKTIRLQRPATEPCRPKAVICLDHGNPPEPFHRVNILAKKAGREILVNELSGISRRILVQDLKGEIFNLRVQYPSGHGLTRAVRALLRHHSEEIWYAIRVDSHGADFTRDPEITRISVQEAALVLLRETRQFPGQVPWDAARKPSAGTLLMQIARLLDGVATYRMRTGRLKETCLLANKVLEEGKG